MKTLLLSKSWAFRNVSDFLNLKTFVFILAFCLPNLVDAQSNPFDGTWIVSSGYHYNDPFIEFNINSRANTLQINSIENQVVSKGKTSFNIGTSITSFSWNRTETNLDTAMNYSRNMSLISIGNPFYLYGYITFIDNVYNNDIASFNCFINGGCRLSNGEYAIRPKPSRVISESELFVGSTAHETIKIDEIRFTEKAIELMLLFTTEENPYLGTLHKPGADFAFFVRDSNGNRYDLLDQMGWEGDDVKGFGSFSVPEESEYHVILYFQPASDPQSVSNLSLLEGECEANCWNFYDIRLKDK